jgi:hypothetical protein
MSLQIDLSAVVNNDLEFSGQATYAGAAFNLTGMTLTAYLKASRTATDESGTEFTPTIATGTQGDFTWVVPHADNDTAGSFWYRIDLNNSGDIATIFFGTFTVNAA